MNDVIGKSGEVPLRVVDEAKWVYSIFCSVMMLKALSINVGRVEFSLLNLSARVIAVSSARLIV